MKLAFASTLQHLNPHGMRNYQSSDLTLNPICKSQKAWEALEASSRNTLHLQRRVSSPTMRRACPSLKTWRCGGPSSGSGDRLVNDNFLMPTEVGYEENWILAAPRIVDTCCRFLLHFGSQAVAFSRQNSGEVGDVGDLRLAQSSVWKGWEG